MARRVAPVAGSMALTVACLMVAACGAEKKTFTLEPLPTTSASTTRVPTTTRPTTVPTTVAPSNQASAQPVRAAWTPITANLVDMPSECGNVSLLSSRPDRDELIVSIAQRGLWTSANGSESWSKLGQGPGSDTVTNRGSTIVYDPQHTATFWESGIYNGAGVYRTDDNGTTLKQLGDIHHVDAVSVDLTDAARRTLLASVHERSVVMRSTDGGQTWTEVSKSLPPGVGFTTEPLVIDGQTHLVGTKQGPDAGVYRTTDGGSSWTQVFKGGVSGHPLLTKSGAMYWIVDGSGGLIKSTDGGVTWTAAARAGTVDTLSPFLVELPDGRLAAVGGQVVVVSADGGASWRSVGPRMPIRPTGFAYSSFRHAFYAWYFTCGREGDNRIPADAIMKLDFDYQTQ
jgi:hypothetical protein